MVANRTRDVLRAMLPVALIFVVQFALEFIFSEILFAYNFRKGLTNPYDLAEAMTEQLNTRVGILSLSIGYSLICGVIFFFWYNRFKREGNRDFVFPPREESSGGLAGSDAGEVSPRNSLRQYSFLLIPGLALVAVGAQYVCNYLVSILSVSFPDWLLMFEEMMDAVGFAEPGALAVPVMIYTVLIAPVMEELCFRGLCFGYIRRALPFWGANIVQAMMFAGIHGNPLQASYTFGLGLLFGYVYGRCRNIAVPILLHMGFNAYNSFVNVDVIIGANAFTFFIILLSSMLCVYLGTTFIIRSIPQEVNDFYRPAGMRIRRPPNE